MIDHVNDIDKSEKFIWLVRLGYAARGLTYALLGWMALETASRAEGGNRAVFAMLEDWSFGEVLLWLIMIGLAAYSAFKFLSAITDIQHRGSDTHGILKRIGDAASGVGYIILAFAAGQFATGSKDAARSDNTSETASTVLSMDLGGLVLGLVGIGFIVGGIMQAREAITANFMHRVSIRAPGGVKTIGRIGHAARAIVFAIIGWSLVRSAWLASSSEAKGVGQALSSLRDEGILYTLTAIGLILFGLFSIAVSRYRIIPDFGQEGLRPNFRS